MANSTSDSKSVKPRSSLLEMFDPFSSFRQSPQDVTPKASGVTHVEVKTDSGGTPNLVRLKEIFTEDQQNANYNVPKSDDKNNADISTNKTEECDSCPKHDATTEQVSPGQTTPSAELHTTNSDFNQSGLVSVPKSSQQDDTLSNESTDGIVVTQLSPELNVQPNVPIFDQPIVAPSDVSEGNKKTGTKVVPEPIAKSIINGIEKCSPQRVRNVKDTKASAVCEKGPLLDLNSPKVPATEVLRLRKANQKLESNLLEYFQETCKMTEMLIKYESKTSEFFGRYQEANKKSLATLESAFYDLLEKHERAKTVITGFKKNETMYKTQVEELNKRISVETEKNNAVREHASRVIDKANQDNLRLQEAQEANTANQDAIIKLLNIELAAAENSLQRKTLECQELSSLCDQVMGKM